MEYSEITLQCCDLDYLNAIRYFAKNNMDNQFTNAGEAHALAVFCTVFDNAETNINILAQSFESDVPNSIDYISSLFRYLKRGGKLKVCLERAISEEQESGLPIFDLLRNSEFSKNVVVKYNSSNIEIPFNMVTADGKIYRFEYDKEKRQAYCNFNDPKTVSTLDGFYHTLS